MGPFPSIMLNLKFLSELFKENTEDRYESAKYGAFRVGESGDHILMDLANENLQKLTIIKE